MGKILLLESTDEILGSIIGPMEFCIDMIVGHEVLINIIKELH